MLSSFFSKRAKLKPHPRVCPNCGEQGSVTYERFTLTRGEYVCDECNWGMDALTGKVTYEGLPGEAAAEEMGSRPKQPTTPVCQNAADTKVGDE